MSRLEETRNNMAYAIELGEFSRPVADDIEYLLNEVERLKGVLRVAEKHISGNWEKFSEREKEPVLFQIAEALKEV